MSREQQIEALAKIDETSKKLQKKGLDREALDCMQLGLLKRKEIFGPQSKELASACRNVGCMFNDIALKNVEASNFDDAIQYLKQASKVTQNDDFVRQLTYQNFAILYQKKGKPRITLKYLKQALMMQTNYNCSLQIDDITRANVHLNMCATLSQLGKHESALRHALISIQILDDERSEMNESNRRHSDLSSRSLSSEMKSIAENESEERMYSSATTEFTETLAASYYNAGVEYEHLNDIQRSYHTYQKGNEIASSLGCSHEISKALKLSCQALSKRIVHDGIGKEMKVPIKLNTAH